MYIYAYNGSNWIFVPIILIFVIYFFYGYCILIFDLLRRVTDIQIFQVRIKTDNESNQNL